MKSKTKCFSSIVAIKITDRIIAIKIAHTVVGWGPESDEKEGGREIKREEFLEIQFYE